MNGNEFEKECAEKLRKKKPQERASLIIRCYYGGLRRGMKTLSEDEKEDAEALGRRFEAWLYDPSDIRQKIKAIEEYYFEVSPEEDAILDDILTRMVSMYAIYGKELENDEKTEKSQSGARRRVKEKV